MSNDNIQKKGIKGIYLKNVKKIFENNRQSSYKVRLEKGVIIYENFDTIFSGITIERIINFVNSVHKKYKKLKVPLIFSFGCIILTDKLSYILFECICYSLMKDYGHRVYIYWKPAMDILTDGVYSSPLKLLNTGKSKTADKFMSQFRMEIYQNHFRRVINGMEKEKTNYLGNLLQELDSFLKYFRITEEYRNQISEVITELVGNACEHGKTDCLLDVDVTNDHLKSVKNIPQEGAFYGINIAIVNFSDILLGDGIRNKIDAEKLVTERYIELERAYDYHKNFFDETYSYTDFCNIAALQDKISGRERHNLMGGTGLTKLIKSLQEKSDMDSCYVLSGDRCVIFDKDYIKYDENGWLGFNENRNFFTEIPNKDAIAGCNVFLPGTAYNLNFVMKREDD